nr:glycosyltransferase 61 family protein [Nocardioides flavescens]
MSEQVSHMWGWAHAKAEHPELRALVFTESGRLERWQTELLTAGGPTEDEITVLRQPHRVERLVGTTPMFSRPAFVHPELRTVYDRIGTELSANSGLTDTPRRIFLSRRGSKRECVNSAEVERLVDEFGFLIICPEDFSLSDQARMVRAADVIAGYAGSQMFSIALAGGSKRVVLFCSESYPAHNEYMLSALLGHQLSVVVCDAQVKRRSGQFSREAFHSNFRFDLARDGAFARRSLS